MCKRYWVAEKGSLINMAFRNQVLSRKTGLLVVLLAVSHSVMSQQTGWTATWTASPEAADPDPNEPLTNLDNQTVRERVRVTVGGRKIRIRISNECSSAPLLVGKISVGVAQGMASAVPIRTGALPFACCPGAFPRLKVE